VKLRYEVVERTRDGCTTRLIEREGPTGLIVTTTQTGLDPQKGRLAQIVLGDPMPEMVMLLPNPNEMGANRGVAPLQTDSIFAVSGVARLQYSGGVGPAPFGS
jgi:hypothetical protein